MTNDSLECCIVSNLFEHQTYYFRIDTYKLKNYQFYYYCKMISEKNMRLKCVSFVTSMVANSPQNVLP